MAAPHLHAPSILRDPEQERIGRKIRRQGKGGSKGRGRAADVPHYGYGDPKKGWQGHVERIPNPIQQSQIDLTWCRVCKQYQLEGSKALGYCRTCGTVNAVTA